MRAVAGLLLTGGASRRFGVDKATLLLDGEPLGERAAALLRRHTSPVLEVGPGFTTLEAVREDPVGSGPLAAIVTGARALDARGAGDRAVVVLAVDLPGVGDQIVEWLARHFAPTSVVPVVDGVAQVLCARYSTDALVTAAQLVDRGERSVQALLREIDVHEAGSEEWGEVGDVRAFRDVDTPDDAAALGLEVPG